MSTVNEIKKHVDNRLDKEYTKVSFILGNEKIDKKNIIDKVIPVMKHTESISNISGCEKKQFVINSLTKLVDKTVDDKNEKKKIQSVIDNIIPKIIDKLVDVDKKKIQIKTKKGIKKLFSCCC